MAGAAGVCAGGWMTESHAAEPAAQLPDEDGYKLWLRYAPPGDAAKNYHDIVKQIRVEASSVTGQVIHAELGNATVAMGGAIMVVMQTHAF